MLPAQAREQPGVVGVAYPNAPELARRLELNQGAPSLECFRQRGQGRVEEVAVDVRRAEVVEGGGERGEDLCVDGGLGIIGKRFGGVLAGYWGVPSGVRVGRDSRELGLGNEAYLVWRNKSSRLNPCLS